MCLPTFADIFETSFCPVSSAQTQEDAAEHWQVKIIYRQLMFGNTLVKLLCRIDDASSSQSLFS